MRPRDGLLLAPAALALAAAVFSAFGLMPRTPWLAEVLTAGLVVGCAAPILVYLVLERTRPRR